MVQSSSRSGGVFNLIPTKDGYWNIVFVQSKYGGDKKFKNYGLTIRNDYKKDRRPSNTKYVSAINNKPLWGKWKIFTRKDKSVTLYFMGNNDGSQK